MEKKEGGTGGRGEVGNKVFDVLLIFLLLFFVGWR